MKITTRLVAVLCLITVLFLMWLLYVQRSAQQQTKLVVSGNGNSKNTRVLIALCGLKGSFCSFCPEALKYARNALDAGADFVEYSSRAITRCCLATETEEPRLLV